MISPEDNDLLDNPKYRQYINSIEKALKSFESSSEWADLIAALGKLNKVLNPKFKVIPRKITIGKRLAQCMHPALPGGVHLKALDVYESIFKIIETKRLQTDLYVYSMGIFPLLVNASMQVRPVLLNMYETYFLPLGKSLQHCIDGMLLALLPGLEEGTELYERTDILLVRVCEKTGDLEFYGALWRCILSSSATRLYAVQLILRRFDRRKTTDDQLFIIGSDIEIMVRALCESLQDNSVLTQRASLDILTLCCPLSHIPISRADCCELLQAALLCLLRRDMSLNRRIYSWLLGHDQTKMRSSTSSLEQEENVYFDTYAKALLTEALALMLGRQINKLTKFDTNFHISASDELFPLRLLVSLLDKQEIGPMIIEDVLVEVFRLLQAAVHFVDKKYDNENFVEDDVDKATRISEISKTANLLLGVFEPGYLWQFLSQQIAQARKHKRRDEKVAIPFRELCGFIQLLLVISSVESYQEVQTHHLPNLLFQMIILFSENVTKLSAAELKQGLETCNTLLELAQPVQPPNSGSLPDENNYIVEQSSPVHYSTVPRDNGYGHDITQCFQVFQEFFCNFVKHRLGGNRSDVDRCLRNLESVGAQRDITQDHNFKSSQSTPPSSVVFYVSGSIGSKGTLKDVELVDIFQLTCQMMVDFSCFPLYCNGRLNRHTQKLEITCDSFPHWLKTLLWCICDCSINASFEICTISISALLDMMSLTNSARRGNSSDNTSIGPGMNCAGMVSVVVLSPMTSNHVTALTNQSSFYQKITRRLWKVLGGDDQYEHHLSAVHLLLRLHAVCPDRRCEEVLLTDMLHCNKDTRLKALEKFTRLWHFTRTLSTKKVSLQNGVNFKHFFRCLFAILDSLNPSLQSTQTSSLFELDCGGRSVAQATASSWLQQCLEERDLVRVLEPLLTVLLHPSTHSKYLDSKDVFKDEHNIPNSSGPSKVIQSQDARDKNDGPHVNESEVINDIVKGKMHYSDLILSLTARSFVEKSDELEAKAEQIVKEVLESVLKKLQEEELPCERDPNTTKFEVGPAAGSSLRKTSDDFSRKCSSVNTFALLYQENFDASRALYSLRSILTMLQTHPRLFTYTAVTSQLSAYTSQSVGGVLIQDLLSRHMQALSGRSFYAEVMSRSHNVMVVDLLFVVCLHYIRSWHPDDVIDPDTLHDIRFASCKLLLSLLEHMTDLARENVAASSNMTSPIASSSIAMSSQQFTPFVRSILNKYDVSKVVLESLFATVQALHVSSGEDVKRPVTVTRSTLGSLNDEELYFWWSGNNLARIKSFQAHLLTLVRALLTFDYHLMETDDYSSNGK
ncbi:unnamed protein product [Clavelina lepadiformis]|uniref:Dopey N-terminal domain-containing protein n=1 Tax=Clavelina lepadiformis TaxID=159417 RepID=A0ABP0FDW2_CLALP